MAHKYAPKRITGSFQPSGGPSIQFHGFMDGTFLDLDFNEDAVSAHVGSDGNVTGTLSANMTATLTMTFVQGSDTNDALSNYVPNGRTSFFPSGTLTIQDLNGTTLASDNGAWIMKMAKITFGKEVTGREWKFYMPNATIFAGGDGL